MEEKHEFFDFAGTFLKDVIRRLCADNDIEGLREYIEKSTHRETLEIAMQQGLSAAVMFGHLGIMREILSHSNLFKEDKKKQGKGFLKEYFLVSIYTERKEVGQLLLDNNPLLFENKKIITAIKKTGFRQEDYKAFVLEAYKTYREKARLLKAMPAAILPKSHTRAHKI